MGEGSCRGKSHPRGKTRKGKRKNSNGKGGEKAEVKRAAQGAKKTAAPLLGNSNWHRTLAKVGKIPP